MKAIRIRQNGTRHSPVVATCIRNAEGILISTTGAQFGRTLGNAARGVTNQGRHYFTDQATDDEVKAFVEAGLIDPPEPAAINGRGCGRNGARQRSPHKLPRPLLQQRDRA